MTPTVFHGLGAVPSELRGSVVAVGTFDGVDLRHQEVLATLLHEAERRSVPALLVVGDQGPGTRRVTSLPETLRLVGALGASRVVLEWGMASSDILVSAVEGAIAPVLLLTGDGKGERDTAPRVLALLSEGDAAGAARLLGYRWFVRGEVVHGDKRGRDLGYPTANLAVSASTPLRHGIYAVEVRRGNGQSLGGVASFGVRPTFGGGAPVLEVFIFDFSDDLYGQTIEIAFVAWVRPELRFDGAAALIARMREDEVEARRLLASAGPGSALDRQLAATIP